MLASAGGYRPLRPNYGGKAETGFATGSLREGWNEVPVKFVRSAGAPAFEGHLLWSSADKLHNGLPEIRWTRLPWDEE
ncbi:MAG: hypothetical protein IMW89_07680 [Ktedonobacteraceae bacterium]|nr:hypothetical protein [Ktedonobacteraceae bacterium]